MKIKSVKLHPFAGIQEKEVNFEDGLNLMLGPNETGKSTIFHAINHGLLTTTNLTTRQFDDTIAAFLPIGGDIIRVTLEIYDDNPDSCYQIQKSWKPGLRNGEAQLIKPDGTEITDEDTVQDIIKSILPATPSTIREVMFSRQSELHQLMEKMKEHAEVQQELSDVLRQNVMEAGGMSVDKFQEIVELKYDNYFGRWNREKQYPEDDNGRDRGIQNKWKQGVGEVLEAWYEKENAEKRYDEIIAYEKKLDELNSKLEDINHELTANKNEFQKLSPIQEGLQQREVQESQLETIEEKFGRIKEISTKWPIYEDKIDSITPELEKLNEQVEELNQEQEKASKKAEIKNLKKRLEKLDGLKNQIEQTKEDLEDTKKVKQDDVEELRSLKDTIRDLRTTVKASKLKLSLSAKQNTEVSVSDADGEKESYSLKQGGEITEEKAGFITVETDELQLTVKSATDDLESVLDELDGKEKRLDSKLEEFDVESFEDAVSQSKLFENYKRNFNQAKQLFKDELGDDEYEDLKTKVEEAGEIEGVREPSVVQKERDQVQEKRRELQNEVDNMSESLDEWKEEFDGNIDNVFAIRADLTGSKKEIESKLDELPELPDEFDSVQTFSSHLEELDGSIDNLREQKANVREQLAELSGGAPEKTSDEYQEIAQEQKVNFEQLNKKAESLARVKDETNHILEGLEEETYQPLVGSFTKWLDTMSGGRFASVEQESELPNAFVTSDNKSLPFDKLSHGTKDLTALAWKLSAAEYFLSDQPGVILLDDPLVDMDGKRREMTAKAIQEFAGEHQVIIFTCHQYYLNVLEDGNVIELDSVA